MKTQIDRIDLLGDSILDNARYVELGDSGASQLQRATDIPIQLVAVDGDVTTDLLESVFPSLRIGGMDERFEADERTNLLVPSPKTGAVLSIGGNDALGGAQVLLREVGMVLEALSFLIPIVEEFRRNYVAVLEELISIYEKEHIRVCTIYNKIPTAPASHLPKETMLALGLFNDVITEEVNRRGLRLIDLRVICDSTDCYSEVSPIEPSEEGGRRIVKAILESFQS